MPFLFCFVYARLPFFRNFYGEKKRCTSPIVAEKKEKHFLCRYATALRWILAFIYQKLYDNPSTQFAPIAS